ncbi:hypothetical protein AAE026_26370 [Bradyrhizobium sp. DN5]
MVAVAALACMGIAHSGGRQPDLRFKIARSGLPPSAQHAIDETMVGV